MVERQPGVARKIATNIAKTGHELVPPGRRKWKHSREWINWMGNVHIAAAKAIGGAAIISIAALTPSLTLTIGTAAGVSYMYGKGLHSVSHRGKSHH